jgi:YD repeat-containing protein
VAAPAALAARTVTGGVGIKRSFQTEQQAVTDRMSVGVNVVSGNLIVHAADLRLVGTGINLSVDRYDNSQDAGTSLDMGAGWSMSTGADVQLTFNQDGSVNYFDPTGATWAFTSNGSGGYNRPSALAADLAKNQDGSYTLFYHHGAISLDFGSDGYLTDEHDKNTNQNRISFAYTTVNGRKSLSSITDAKGRTTTVAYDPTSGFVSSLTDPWPRTLQYGYDSAGDMASSHDEDGAIYGYSYDAGHHLTRIENPDGDFTTISYDGQNRVTAVTRVTNTSNMTGSTTGFSYGTGQGCTNSSDSTTVVTDPDGNKTTYCFSASQNPLFEVDQVIDARGHSRSLGYSPEGDVNKYTTATSQTPWTLAYNNPGDPKSISAPTGASWTLSYQGANP